MHRASNPLNDADEGQLLALRFGPFELDVRSGELRRNGTTVRLQPQPFKVLLLLACRPGDVVTREEVQAEVWPAGTFVDFEQSLNFCVRQIRSALGDNANAPRYVETLPRRGYRWVGGAVERVTAPATVREWPRPVPAEPRDPVAEDHPPEDALHLPEPPAAAAPRRRRARPPGPRPRGARRLRGVEGRSRRARLRRRSRRPSSASRSVAGRWTPPASAPDGQVVYSASWEGGPRGLHVAGSGPGDSRGLDIDNALVAAVSPSGEVAFLREGVLARAPLAGGPPKEVLKGVVAADWTRDGADFAVVREGDEGRFRIEFPVGHVLAEPSRGRAALRVSPDGRHVAIAEHPTLDDDRGLVVILDRAGRRVATTGEWASLDGLAWAPDGREVWFTASAVGADNAVHALSLDGRVRPVLAGMGRLVLHDVAPDGRVAPRAGDAALRGAVPPRRREPRTSDLSWLDFSAVEGISPDGGDDPLLRERAGRRAGLRHVPAHDGRHAPRARRLRAGRSACRPDGALGALRQPAASPTTST